MSQIDYDETNRRYEIRSPDAKVSTYFVFPPTLEPGDRLPPLLIYAWSEGVTFKFDGQYNDKSDNLEFFIEGPVGFVYKMSLQVDLPGEGYAWKIKRHAHTNTGKDNGATRIYVPRALCMNPNTLVESGREVVKRWTFYGRVLPRQFGRLRLKLAFFPARCGGNPDNAHGRSSKGVYKYYNKEESAMRHGYVSTRRGEQVGGGTAFSRRAAGLVSAPGEEEEEEGGEVQPQVSVSYSDPGLAREGQPESGSAGKKNNRCCCFLAQGTHSHNSACGEDHRHRTAADADADADADSLSVHQGGGVSSGEGAENEPVGGLPSEGSGAGSVSTNFYSEMASGMSTNDGRAEANSSPGRSGSGGGGPPRPMEMYYHDQESESLDAATQSTTSERTETATTATSGLGCANLMRHACLGDDGIQLLDDSGPLNPLQSVRDACLSKDYSNNENEGVVGDLSCSDNISRFSSLAQSCSQQFELDTNDLGDEKSTSVESKETPPASPVQICSRPACEPVCAPMTEKKLDLTKHVSIAGQFPPRLRNYLGWEHDAPSCQNIPCPRTGAGCTSADAICDGKAIEPSKRVPQVTKKFNQRFSFSDVQVACEDIEI